MICEEERRLVKRWHLAESAILEQATSSVLVSGVIANDPAGTSKAKSLRSRKEPPVTRSDRFPHLEHSPANH